MKKYALFIALAITPWLTISCAQNSVPKTVGNPTAPGVKPYPLDTCLVIDRKLSSTAVTYTRVHEGQEVKFCCAPCIKKFERNPEKFLAKLN